MKITLTIGRRGWYLLFLTLLDFSIAFNLIQPETLKNPVSQIAIKIFPLYMWAAWWAVVGALCFICAFVIRDAWGFAAATMIKVIWGVLFFAAWIDGTLVRGWLGGIVYFAFAAITLLISTWPEEQ